VEKWDFYLHRRYKISLKLREIWASISIMLWYMVNGNMDPDFIELLKASAYSISFIYTALTVYHARAESINADRVLNLISYSSEEGVVAGHSGQFTPRGYLSTVKHAA